MAIESWLQLQKMVVLELVLNIAWYLHIKVKFHIILFYDQWLLLFLVLWCIPCFTLMNHCHLVTVWAVPPTMHLSQCANIGRNYFGKLMMLTSAISFFLRGRFLIPTLLYSSQLFLSNENDLHMNSCVSFSQKHWEYWQRFLNICRWCIWWCRHGHNRISQSNGG